MKKYFQYFFVPSCLCGKIIFLLTLISFSSSAQTRDELEKKKDNLLKEINDIQNQLDKTKKNKTANMNDLYTLQQKITARQNLIFNYNKQLSGIDSSIGETQTKVNTLDAQVKKLKDDYARMVVYSYKHRGSYSKLLFIFSAKNFNDAIRRLQYVKKLNAYRRSKVTMIKLAQKDLTANIELLKVSRGEKTIAINEETQHATQLSLEKKQKDKLVKDLSKQEKKLLADINNKKKEQKKLNAQIADAIKKEILASTPKPVVTKTTGGTTPKKTNVTTTPSVTPEVKAMSASFVANQGKFPWPVEHGDIIETFGTHPHPVLKNVTTKNNGVDIKTTQAANVRTVFKGKVVNVITNATYHKAVIIKHGEYFTVYSNLLSVNVKAGDEVDTKQNIGVAYTDDGGLSMVHFELWLNTVLQNPENWLATK